jgi:hypothetical protein
MPSSACRHIFTDSRISSMRTMYLAQTSPWVETGTLRSRNEAVVLTPVVVTLTHSQELGIIAPRRLLYSLGIRTRHRSAYRLHVSISQELSS